MAASILAETLLSSPEPNSTLYVCRCMSVRGVVFDRGVGKIGDSSIKGVVTATD